MDIQLLTAFLKWCTLINGALLVVWTLCLAAMPDFVYRLQNAWFPLSRDTYNVVIYAFLGLFKVFFLVFNLTPLIVLLIID